MEKTERSDTTNRQYSIVNIQFGYGLSALDIYPQSQLVLSEKSINPKSREERYTCDQKKGPKTSPLSYKPKNNRPQKDPCIDPSREYPVDLSADVYWFIPNGQ